VTVLQMMLVHIVQKLRSELCMYSRLVELVQEGAGTIGARFPGTCDTIRLVMSGPGSLESVGM
jgi:hypothetical protein